MGVKGGGGGGDGIQFIGGHTQTQKKKETYRELDRVELPGLGVPNKGGGGKSSGRWLNDCCCWLLSGSSPAEAGRGSGFGWRDGRNLFLEGEDGAAQAKGQEDGDEHFSQAVTPEEGGHCLCGWVSWVGGWVGWLGRELILAGWGGKSARTHLVHGRNVKLVLQEVVGAKEGDAGGDGRGDRVSTRCGNVGDVGEGGGRGRCFFNLPGSDCRKNFPCLGHGAGPLGPQVHAGARCQPEEREIAANKPLYMYREWLGWWIGLDVFPSGTHPLNPPI